MNLRGQYQSCNWLEHYVSIFEACVLIILNGEARYQENPIVINSKFEEVVHPDANDFCYITDDTYSKDEVCRMEHLILKTLDFKCSPPTIIFYVGHFSKLSGVPGGKGAMVLNYVRGHKSQNCEYTHVLCQNKFYSFRSEAKIN